jgi:hypothetical protein
VRTNRTAGRSIMGITRNHRLLRIIALVAVHVFELTLSGRDHASLRGELVIATFPGDYHSCRSTSNDRDSRGLTRFRDDSSVDLRLTYSDS